MRQDKERRADDASREMSHFRNVHGKPLGEMHQTRRLAGSCAAEQQYYPAQENQQGEQSRNNGRNPAAGPRRSMTELYPVRLPFDDGVANCGDRERRQVIDEPKEHEGADGRGRLAGNDVRQHDKLKHAESAGRVRKNRGEDGQHVSGQENLERNLQVIRKQRPQRARRQAQLHKGRNHLSESNSKTGKL